MHDGWIWSGSDVVKALPVCNCFAIALIHRTAIIEPTLNKNLTKTIRVTALWGFQPLALALADTGSGRQSFTEAVKGCLHVVELVHLELRLACERCEK